MATVSIKIPDDMKKKVDEMSDEGLYQNGSEYIRTAIREKIEKDTGLTSAEERELAERIRDVKNGEVETVALEDIK